MTAHRVPLVVVGHEARVVYFDDSVTCAVDVGEVVCRGVGLVDICDVP